MASLDKDPMKVGSEPFDEELDWGEVEEAPDGSKADDADSAAKADQVGFGATDEVNAPSSAGSEVDGAKDEAEETKSDAAEADGAQSDGTDSDAGLSGTAQAEPQGSRTQSDLSIFDSLVPKTAEATSSEAEAATESRSKASVPFSPGLVSSKPPPPPPPPSMPPAPVPPSGTGGSEASPVDPESAIETVPLTFPPPSLTVGPPESVPPSVQRAIEAEAAESAAVQSRSEARSSTPSLRASAPPPPPKPSSGSLVPPPPPVPNSLSGSLAPPPPPVTSKTPSSLAPPPPPPVAGKTPSSLAPPPPPPVTGKTPSSLVPPPPPGTSKMPSGSLAPPPPPVSKTVPSASLPPPPKPPAFGSKRPSGADWDSDGDRDSVATASEDETRKVPRPVPSALTMAGSALQPGGRGMLLASIVLVGLVIVGGLAFAFWPRKGELIVNVSGPGGVAITDLEVLVDDEVTCTESPCSASNLAAGQHSLRVVADKYQRPAKRIVVVPSGDVETVDVELIPVSAVKVTAGEARSRGSAGEPGAASEEAIPTLDMSRSGDTEGKDAEEEREGSSTTRTTGGSRAVARAVATPVARPTSGKGRININSYPASNAVVDGKPVGRTPTSVTVAAGAHRVMFVHPQKGRRVVAVRVNPGQTAGASVRF